MTTLSTAFARSLGVAFAQQLNESPAEAQNWNALSQADELPEFDYLALREHYGFRDLEQSDVRRVEAAYRDGFNATFGA